MCLEAELHQVRPSLDFVLADIFGHLDALASLRPCRAVSDSWRREAQGAQAAWKDAAFDAFPGMAAAVLTQTQVADEGSSPGTDTDWFKLFVARCAKRREWAAKKGASKSKKAGHAARLNAERSGELERATKFAIGPEGRNNRTRQVREKTCKRCGERFTPAAGGACCFHSGQYQSIGKAIQISHPHGDRGGGRRGQSKRAGKEDLEVCGDFQWSCCLATDSKAPGCKSADHY